MTGDVVGGERRRYGCTGGRAAGPQVRRATSPVHSSGV